ncbi:hypothetical protein LUX73_43275 [Actinomadura madurae]|nr:hypothetical protein [Actinomadura madurae]MCQ0010850.1 hypothetical protein [Actinomadura madurae]
MADAIPATEQVSSMTCAWSGSPGPKTTTAGSPSSAVSTEASVKYVA